MVCLRTNFFNRQVETRDRLLADLFVPGLNIISTGNLTLPPEFLWLNDHLPSKTTYSIASLNEKNRKRWSENQEPEIIT